MAIVFGWTSRFFYRGLRHWRVWNTFWERNMMNPELTWGFRKSFCHLWDVLIYHHGLLTWNATWLGSPHAHYHWNYHMTSTYNRLWVYQINSIWFYDPATDCSYLAAFRLFSNLRRGVNRFVADVQKMEKRFGTKILCQERLKMLDQKANYWENRPQHGKSMNLGRQLLLWQKGWQTWIFEMVNEETCKTRQSATSTVRKNVPIGITIHSHLTWTHCLIAYDCWNKILLWMIYFCFAPPWSWNPDLPNPIR